MLQLEMAAEDGEPGGGAHLGQAAQALESLKTLLERRRGELNQTGEP